MSIKNSIYWGKPKEAFGAWGANLLGLCFLALFGSLLLPDISFFELLLPFLLGFGIVLCLTFTLKQSQKSKNKGQ